MQFETNVRSLPFKVPSAQNSWLQHYSSTEALDTVCVTQLDTTAICCTDAAKAHSQRGDIVASKRAAMSAFGAAMGSLPQHPAPMPHSSRRACALRSDPQLCWCQPAICKDISTLFS